MKQLIYKVVVPFSHIANDSLSHSLECMLPKQLRVGGIQIIKQTQHTYIAEFDIVAPTPDKAVSQAVMLLENLIYLFAIGNHAFRIDFGSLVSFKEADGKKLDFSNSDNSFKLKQFYIKNSFRPIPHITFTQILENFSFEENALSWANDWPDWLRLVIELNYLAVISRNVKTAIVNLYSALEVLTKAIIPKPSTLLKEHFKDNSHDKMLFIADLEMTVRKHGFDSLKSKRLIAQLENCYSLSDKVRIFDALKKCAVESNLQEIELARRQRSSIVHSGRNHRSDELVIAEKLEKKWVQGAIKNLINSRLKIIENCDS